MRPDGKWKRQTILTNYYAVFHTHSYIEWLLFLPPQHPFNPLGTSKYPLGKSQQQTNKKPFSLLTLCDADHTGYSSGNEI